MEFALPDVSQGFQKTKDFLSETAQKGVTSVTDAAEKATTALSASAEQAKQAIASTTSSAVNTVNQATSQAVGTVAETTEKAKSSLAETASQAVSSVSATTSKAVGSVLETADKAKEAIAQSSNSAVTAIDRASSQALGTVSQFTENAKSVLGETTTQAVNSVNEAAQKAQTSLESSLQKAQELERSFSDGIQSAVSSSLNDWFHAHPVIFWIVTHPIASAAIALGGILLFALLLKVTGRLMEDTLLSAIKAPFKRAGSISGGGVKQSPQVMANGLFSAKYEDSSKNSGENRLQNILNRLEAIKQEQDVLLKELAALVRAENVRAK